MTDATSTSTSTAGVARLERRRGRLARVTAAAAAGAALALLLAGCGAGVAVGDAAAPAAPAAPAAANSAPAAAPGAPVVPASTTGGTTPVVTPGSAAPAAAAPAQAPAALLKLGARGPAVSAVQQQLSDKGYWLGNADGTFGQLTRQAVIAFQKAEGLSPDGVAGPRTQAKIQTAGRPTARTMSGNHMEVDLKRQLLLVVRDGQVQWAFNTSTGNGDTYRSSSGGSAVARTPKGDYVFQRQIDGIRRAPLGQLYRPKYFNGGIAVHGAGSVPARPASHGCVRVTNAAMDLLWSSGVAPLGSPITVY